MPASRVIDTAIVLAAVYLALSVVVSQIVEQISAAANWRGKQLYSGVLHLLCSSEDLRDALFKHPLAASAKKDGDGQGGPSGAYIGPRDFSLALWQLVLVAKVSPNPAKGQPDLDFPLDDLKNVTSALVYALQAQVAIFPAPLRASLYALLAEARGDYDRLLQVTDLWFSRQMDRVTGWYKRNSQLVIFAISTALILLFGVDTVRIVARLYVDDSLRPVLATAVATSIHSSPAPKNDSGAAAGKTISSEQAQQLLGALDNPSFVSSFAGGPLDGWDPQNLQQSLVHLLGLVITVLAVSLGAPFWFDALQLLVNVRLTGPKPSAPAAATASPKDAS